MRRFCSGIVGIVLAFTLAGCGESAPEGPVEFKATNNDAINKLRENMSENMKKNKFMEKPTEVKPAEKKPSGAKPEKKE